jgi:AcrR family transcriptional regulator
MTALAGHDSGTAVRILAAARELVLKRGVRGLTIAEIADRAHVGKGTAYLYWSAKEDLLFELFARDFLDAVEVEIELVSVDPDACRPHRLCPRLVRDALSRPFVNALQAGDVDLLGVLAGHPHSRELLDMVGPAVLMQVGLPMWRRHRLVRDDWALEEQAYALHALITGFLGIAGGTQAMRDVTAADSDKVMAAAVIALLGPGEATPADVRAAADAGLELLRDRREAVRALIAHKQEKHITVTQGGRDMTQVTTKPKTVLDRYITLFDRAVHDPAELERLHTIYAPDATVQLTEEMEPVTGLEAITEFYRGMCGTMADSKHLWDVTEFDDGRLECTWISVSRLRDGRLVVGSGIERATVNAAGLLTSLRNKMVPPPTF